MKMKKLIVALVVVTMLTASVVCSAATYTTTTTYRPADGKVQVTTAINDLPAGSMATYVLYGNGSTDYATNDNIDFVSGEPTENNILYIDQNNNVSSSVTFGSGVWLDADKVMGSKVIVGTDATDVTIDDNGSEILDQGIACFKLALDANSSLDLAKISDITVSYTFKGEAKEYPINSTQDFVYIPAGIDYTLTFNVADASVMGTVSIGDTDVSDEIVMNKYKGTSSADDKDTVKTLTLGEGADPATGTNYMSIDSNPIFGTIDEHQTIAFIINNKLEGYTETGIDIIAYEKGTANKANEVLNLKNMSDSQTYAIRLVDELGTFIDNSLYDYEAVPYYMEDGEQKVTLTKYVNSSYYIVNKEDVNVTEEDGVSNSSIDYIDESELNSIDDTSSNATGDADSNITDNTTSDDTNDTDSTVSDNTLSDENGDINSEVITDTDNTELDDASNTEELDAVN